MIVAVCGWSEGARGGRGRDGRGGRQFRLFARTARTRACGRLRRISTAVGALTATEARRFRVAAAILARGKRFAADSEWSARLVARLPGAMLAPIIGTDALIATAAEKARMFDATGAHTADMESHIAAEIAQSRGLPFAGLRIVADAATSDRPLAQALRSRRRKGDPPLCWDRL
jgi:nucleoside phosphorylase